MRESWVCRECGEEGSETGMDIYGRQHICKGGASYGSCHECGKPAKLVPSGAAFKDPGSVCNGCFDKLQDQRVRGPGAARGDTTVPKARKPSKRQVEKQRDDLIDMLKEFEN